MSFLSNNNLRLFARNEGKIKRYESCSDVRAWSHDLQVRSMYLREWIKRDMPICVIPISTLTRLLRTMTCKSRGRATPRCHPDCKSKILLESICASCTVMKECLKQNENMGKYFEEEEFETSHWPCERCLEALKSIKMFWKIIIEKIFNINISKEAAFDNCNNYSRVESVKTLAKVWQKEIKGQTLLIKKLSPLLSTQINKQTRHLTDKSTNTDCISNSSINKTSKKSVRKITKSTSLRIQMADVKCDACSLENENAEIRAYKANIEYLQDKYNRQKKELERLEQENSSLKIDLQNALNYCHWKPAYCTPAEMSPDDDKVALVSQPLDTCVEEKVHADSTKDTDSEVIITMRNCKNENFKHVSLLQVLHKTNAPIPNEYNTGGSCCSNQNPIDLLTRVHKTFGEIVRRELFIAGDRRHRNKKYDIEATFRKVGVSRSMPSCSTGSNISVSSLYISAKDVFSD